MAGFFGFSPVRLAYSTMAGMRYCASLFGKIVITPPPPFVGVLAYGAGHTAIAGINGKPAVWTVLPSLRDCLLMESVFCRLAAVAGCVFFQK